MHGARLTGQTGVSFSISPASDNYNKYSITFNRFGTTMFLQHKLALTANHAGMRSFQNSLKTSPEC